MKLFLAGDFNTDTGPGISNKMLKAGLKNNNNVRFSRRQSKAFRVLEMIMETAKSDCVCFCSPSKGNIIGIKVAKLLGKPSFYVMHGYLTYEKQKNDPNISEAKLCKIQGFEKYIFDNVNKVFCVSETFMEYMKEAEPEYAQKFDYNYNGLDLPRLESVVLNKHINRTQNQIVSIGGGMRQKNILTICRAIRKLNKEKNMGLKLTVIGPPHSDKAEICSYDFVSYYEKLPREEVLEILSSSYLYIQNSSFETFGLSVIESLVLGCNLLISNKVGAVRLLETVEESDLIYDVQSVEQVACKIEGILSNGNAIRLQQGLRRDQIDCTVAANLLLGKIVSSVNRKKR